MRSYRDYFYPGTTVLSNKLGIRDARQLAEAEALLSAARMRQKLDVPLNADGLKAIHRHIFQDVYAWAGEFRAVDMIKLGEDGRASVSFAPGARIAPIEIPRFFGELQSDIANGSFDGLDARTFAYRAAVYVADLNHIHPFPEGNGRTQRIFLALLAGRAGYRLIDKRLSREAWLAAAIDSFVQDARRKGHFGAHRLMTDLIAKALESIHAG